MWLTNNPNRNTSARTPILPQPHSPRLLIQPNIHGLPNDKSQLSWATTIVLDTELGARCDDCECILKWKPIPYFCVLLLTRAVWSLVKSSALYRVWVTFRTETWSEWFPSCISWQTDGQFRQARMTGRCSPSQSVQTKPYFEEIWRAAKTRRQTLLATLLPRGFSGVSGTWRKQHWQDVCLLACGSCRLTKVLGTALQGVRLGPVWLSW